MRSNCYISFIKAEHSRLGLSVNMKIDNPGNYTTIPISILFFPSRQKGNAVVMTKHGIDHYIEYSKNFGS